jgi:hypothetical protein
MAAINISVQTLWNSATYEVYPVDTTDTIANVKLDIESATGCNVAWFDLVFNNQVLGTANTVASFNIVEGSVLRTANKIARLPTLEDRQLAKLELSKIEREIEGNTRPNFDILELPTRYVGNTVVDNPNPDGLVIGRPWIEGPTPYVNPEPIAIGTGVSVVAQSPFAGGGNSYLFDGTANSFINYAGSDSWAVGTSDFTVEWFSRQSSLVTPQFQRIFSVGDFPTIKIGVSIESGAFYYWANDAFRYSSSSASTANVWIHWAVVRASGVTKIYRNGSLLGSQITDTNNITDNTTILSIGNTKTPASIAALIGNLTNLRWVKGLAVYTGNFTVPTSTLTATSSANPYGGSNTQAIPDGFTKLLVTP